MLVKYWMNKHIVTIDAGSSMPEAMKLMKKHMTKMLPVVTKGKLVGVVTDRDLKRASASDATLLEVHELAYLLSRIKVKDLMTPTPFTVSPNETLEEAAARLLMQDISGAPVVDANGRIVGSISQKEIFRALATLSGYGKQGLQLALRIEDRPGSIQEVTDEIRAYGGRLVSILTSTSEAPEGYRHLYVRTYGVNRDKVPHLVDQLRRTATLLYMVDHRENTRREFQRSKQVA